MVLFEELMNTKQHLPLSSPICQHPLSYSQGLAHVDVISAVPRLNPGKGCNTSQKQWFEKQFGEELPHLQSLLQLYYCNNLGLFTWCNLTFSKISQIFVLQDCQFLGIHKVEKPYQSKTDPKDTNTVSLLLPDWDNAHFTAWVSEPRVSISSVMSDFTYTLTLYCTRNIRCCVRLSDLGPLEYLGPCCTFTVQLAENEESECQLTFKVPEGIASKQHCKKGFTIADIKHSFQLMDGWEDELLCSNTRSIALNATEEGTVPIEQFFSAVYTPNCSTTSKCLIVKAILATELWCCVGRLKIPRDTTHFPSCNDSTVLIYFRGKSINTNPWQMYYSLVQEQISNIVKFAINHNKLL